MWEHGTTTGYGRYKCRCPECSRARADYIKKYKQDRRSGISRKKEPWKHGTVRGYMNYDCRCDLCRTAMAEDRSRKLESGEFTHGTREGYIVGCRCDECRACSIEYFKKYRRKIGISEQRHADHGSKKIYKSGCRCDICVSWYRDKHPLKRKPKDPIQNKLRHALRGRLLVALKHNFKCGSAVSDLGCSIEEFKIHLESQFVDGMTWGNYGKKVGDWSIDHIMPLNLFDLTNREQFLVACHYTNMRPLWHLDNMRRPDDGSDVLME